MFVIFYTYNVHYILQVTPNRLSELQYQHGSTNTSDSGSNNGEFKRSASARLHRNKKNYPDMFHNQSDLGGMHDESRKKEQVIMELNDIVMYRTVVLKIVENLKTTQNFEHNLQK